MTDAPDSAGEAQGVLTLAQIAELAGVSTATVSKVVNGHQEVASDTRAMVESVIQRHGYRRQKRQAKAQLLEVVFHELAGPYPVSVLNGVERAARAHGLSIVLTQLQGRHEPGRSWTDTVLTRRPTGVVMVYSELTSAQQVQLASRDIPFVLVDPTGEPAHGVPSVGADNWSGGLAATRHLVNLGHRRVAIITGGPMLSARARLDGYRAALEEAGLPVDPTLIREGEYRIVDGYRHTTALMRLPEPPTAIFASNDGEALGVYQAAHALGLRIPDDLSVVGFDDLPPAEIMIPALTTVRQPLGEMAAIATELVVELSRGLSDRQRRVVLPTELVVRASTAPPRRRLTP
ncbi:LacI family DNA-binding transcriptional regulator [Actinokineospora fastidiosa]|uniref:LacI family transcriptional regulator n=1 Tax=Actinokineospora fastidiosa TaxID=1816 RepID=A0A918LJY0_9PSEU|nr:LacI family DNA-binding transcriptional regulator [Actinokineospora fastidiosa]GGS58826.1 LacI family transcriptional regulator [Actinokineospora fastidiosa]